MREVLKKASSSMYPEIPVTSLSHCGIARKGKLRHRNKRGDLLKKEITSDKKLGRVRLGKHGGPLGQVRREGSR